MKELTEYRQKLLDRFAAAATEFREACLAVRRPFDPLEAGGWSLHQVAVHARDIDKLVYGLRARRTLSEDNPKFPNFDGEAYMAGHYNAQEPLGELLDELVNSVQGLVTELRSMPVEGWSRVSAHETQGDGLTLQTWVERGLDHLEEHLATVKKARSST